MKKLLSILTFMFLSCAIFAQSTEAIDSIPKEKVIYPVGQVSDTVSLWAVLVNFTGAPLVAKQYIAITDYYVFANETKRSPQPFKQRFVTLQGTVVDNFPELVIWNKTVKNDKKQ
jgi:hypothetical protein